MLLMMARLSYPQNLPKDGSATDDPSYTSMKSSLHDGRDPPNVISNNLVIHFCKRHKTSRKDKVLFHIVLFSIINLYSLMAHVELDLGDLNNQLKYGFHPCVKPI